MSGLEVISAISAVIALLDASIKIYDSGQNDMKLSAAFKIIRRRLPVLLHILETCKTNLEPRKDAIPQDVCKALKKTLNICNEKASNLTSIFAKVIPGENDTRGERYLKVLRRLGKGNKVEELMRSITQDVQIVVNHNAVRCGNQQQTLELENIVKEMKSVDSSMPGEQISAMTFSSDGGVQRNNVNNGSGQQINNYARVETQHFYSGKVTSVTFRPREDFGFRRPIGLCLGKAPYIAPELFVDRSSELDQIAQILHHSHIPRKQPRLFLRGSRGVGKTQLAIAYAESRRESYSSVLWLNAASKAALKGSFRSIASVICPIQDSEVLEGNAIVEYVHYWLSDPENSGWLLIFDNYDEPGEFEINDYFPPASHGAIVVTTRRPDLVSGRTLDIKPFESVEGGLEILQTRSKKTLFIEA